MTVVDITEEQMNIIQEYLKGIIEINKTVNLTRITDQKEAELLHIEDSISALPEINEAPEGLYGDLGTGGGFPGVPLGIITGRQTILVDSVKKKLNAIECVLQDLSIQDIVVNASRIEDLANEMPKKFSVLTARALSSLSSLLELACPLLRMNGQLICLKSHVSDEELNSAQSLEKKLGMKLIKQRSFYLSDSETYREILVFEKVAKPKIKLPRRVGMAQKKPLSEK